MEKETKPRKYGKRVPSVGIYGQKKGNAFSKKKCMPFPHRKEEGMRNGCHGKFPGHQ